MVRRILIIVLAGFMAETTGMAVSAGEIAHVSGGIGIDEQQRLEAREREFNLKLVFTLNEGNYVAGVNVGVTDGKGRTVVEDVADGPFFMAKLPAGNYTVAATYEGKTLTRKVQVGSKGLHTENLRWPSNPQTDNVAVSRWLETAQNSR